MICTIYWDLDPILLRLGSFGIRYYSLCWVVGFILGYIVVRKLFIKERLDIELLDRLLAYVLAGALIGARLGHCIFYDWAYYSHHLLEIILPIQFTPTGVQFIGYAGLASHGGTIGVMLALFFFYRKYKMPLLALFDKLALVAPLAGAFIRIGNFFNSEILGAPSSVPWAVIFAKVDSLPRHPAQLYEAIAYLVIFAMLLIVYYKTRNREEGLVFGLSIFLIFTARILIEYCKEVQEPFELSMRNTIGLDMGQVLSIPFVILGLFFFIRGMKNKKEVSSPPMKKKKEPTHYAKAIKK